MMSFSLLKATSSDGDTESFGVFAATLLAEKEFSARKAASNGLLAEDLKMLRERLVLQ